jgi:outer membrane protein assembly factor BamD
MRRTFLKNSSRYLMLGLCLTLAVPGHAILHKKKKNKKVDLSANPMADVNSKQPDKELYDKAMVALKKGKFDVARLDLQTLLNTYPDSEYQMRAKLTVGDTWFKEGGSAALAQAEQEYKDFETFFPNVPEAAEAQMKVGDIYFSEMEKPDRDPQNVIHAEQEYRQMIQQFPDSTLVPRAKQRLREVQEVLAQREFEIGQFYVGRENWSAAIARLQTVADTYPLFSHSDQTLLSIGDAYAAQAQLAQNFKQIPEKARAELIRAYDDRAAAAWDEVVTRYAMSPHVEDAKDRLIAMGRPVPEPTAAQMAESEAEEGSRMPVKLKDHVLFLVQHGPSTVESARVGEPSMTDPAPTYAPAVTAQTLANFNLAIKGEPIPPVGGATAAETAAINNGTAPPRTGSPAPVTMDNVPDTSGAAGTTVGAEIVSAPNSTAAAGSAAATGSDAGGTLISTPPSGSAVGAPSEGGSMGPAAGGATAPLANPFAAYGLKTPVGPAASTTLPPIDKPAAPADQINDVKNGGPAQVATGTTSGKPKKKNPKPAYDSKDESSSKHKPKKGLDKINPL